MFQDGSVDTISPSMFRTQVRSNQLRPSARGTAKQCVPTKGLNWLGVPLKRALHSSDTPPVPQPAKQIETHPLPAAISRESIWCWPNSPAKCTGAYFSPERRTLAVPQRPESISPSWITVDTVLESIVFPLNNFKHFLTLFSKFFASFPHGTCSLSVSRQYLALDEIYHPFCTALPSNATLRKRIVQRRIRVTDGTLTLYDALFQKT